MPPKKAGPVRLPGLVEVDRVAPGALDHAEHHLIVFVGIEFPASDAEHPRAAEEPTASVIGGYRTILAPVIRSPSSM